MECCTSLSRVLLEECRELEVPWSICLRKLIYIYMGNLHIICICLKALDCFPLVLDGDVLPFKLSDIGEGIAEVTVKEW
jgi:hypothetical protein